MFPSIPHRAPRTAAVALTAVSVLALAACGGTDSPSAGAGATLSATESPWSQWLAQFDGGATTQADLDAQNAPIAEAVARCMKEQGFDYIPDSLSGISDDIPEEDTHGLERDSVEYAAQYGYGLFADPRTDDSADQQDVYVDPNEAYLSTLTDTERQAYETALDGDLALFEDPDVDPSTIPLKEQGCRAIGYATAGPAVTAPESTIWDSAEWQAISQESASLWDDVESDPELAKAKSAWVECMADAGYAAEDWTEPHEAEQSFLDVSNRMMNEAMPDGPNPEVEDYKTTDEGKQLAEQERDTAVADYTCRDSVDYEQTRLRVQFRVEHEFMDGHRDALDALVAMYAQSAK